MKRLIVGQDVICKNTRHLVQLGLFTALALVLFIVDLRLTLWVALPGLKLGLANLVTLLALTVFAPRAVFLLVIARTCLGAVLGGGGFGLAFAMSLSAGLTSAAVMLYGYRHWQPFFSLIGISVAGAAVHNVTQLTVAALALGSTNVYAYLPYLLHTGTLTGMAMGYMAVSTVSRLLCCYASYRQETRQTGYA
jgi:heptaprenyl diphosphate synthase